MKPLVVEEIGSIVLAPLPDDWDETDEETMQQAQELAVGSHRTGE